ncbi:MAG: hypothetical protein UY11_C0047G0012, partial [Candidatus Amesbacteria bacterium GW2011_GWC2_47_8]
MAASSSQRSVRRPVRAPDSFLEALQELGKGVVSEAKIQVQNVVTQDIPQSFGFSGDLHPDQPVSVESLHKTEVRFNNRLQQERLLYLRSETETKQQITAILQEIQSLAKSTGQMAHEVQIATMQAVVNPGVYHRNFFEQLRSFIKAIRAKVTESRHWLATQSA